LSADRGLEGRSGLIVDVVETIRVSGEDTVRRAEHIVKRMYHRAIRECAERRGAEGGGAYIETSLRSSIREW